jgi:hypothetical protein
METTINNTVLPEDLRVMFFGKQALELIEMRVRATNQLKAYEKSYPEVMTLVKESLDDTVEEIYSKFDTVKRRMSREIEKHPLWERMGFIKGLSSYNMAIIMSQIKNINRFGVPSALCVYAGIASIGGHAITKAKIKDIKEVSAEHGKDFKGFNTGLSGRLFVLSDCFFRSRGFFYEYYLRLKERLYKQAINDGRTVQREDGVLIMKGKNNHPLKAWAHANARRRTLRVFLHILWQEWRKVNNLLVDKKSYAVDYLGHRQYITIEDVYRYEIEKDDSIIKNS